MAYKMEELPRCHYCNNGQVPIYAEDKHLFGGRLHIVGWRDCHFCDGEGIFLCRPPQPADPQPKE